MEKLFEIKHLLHTLREISFSWNDIGGYYRVYKNNQQVYEGTVAKFTDGETVADRIRYTIERVAGGAVKDVLVIHTSGLTVVKEGAHPLQQLVVSTITSASQTAVSWQRMKGVETFDVYRNGKYVCTVNENYYTDQSSNEASENVTYSISAVRPLKDSHQKLNNSKSLIATFIEPLLQGKRRNESSEEHHMFSVQMRARNELLVPFAERRKEQRHENWQFRYTTFLADPLIKNPNYLSRYPYFAGDGRNFDAEGKTFRTRVHINGKFTECGSSLEYRKAAGPTIGLNYLKRYKKHEYASVDEIEIRKSEGNSCETCFEIIHSAANPLTFSPAIHYEAAGRLDVSGGADLIGYHNDAPHHEVYIAFDEGEWIPVHRAASKGLIYLTNMLGDNYWRYIICH